MPESSRQRAAAYSSARSSKPASARSTRTASAGSQRTRFESGTRARSVSNQRTSSVHDPRSASGNVRQTISQLGQSDLQRLRTGSNIQPQYETRVRRSDNVYNDLNEYASRRDRHNEYVGRSSRDYDDHADSRDYSARYDDTYDYYDEYELENELEYRNFRSRQSEDDLEYENSRSRQSGQIHQKSKKRKPGNKNRRRRRESQKSGRQLRRHTPGRSARKASATKGLAKKNYAGRNAAKARKRRKKRNINKKPIIITMLIFIITAALVVGMVLFIKYRTFTGYTVLSTLSISNSENGTQYYKYADGYLKCSSTGVTYFDDSRIIWSESVSMIQPVVDICENYIAVADTSKKSVYIYDKAGLVNEIALNYIVTDVEISQSGVVAVSSNDGDVSYLQLFDKSGSEIMVQKSLLSSQGYLMDIALSDSGTKMAAVFVNVEQGSLGSQVVFYDLSGEEPVTTSFDQYESVLLASVHFLDNNVISVVGDTAMSIYAFEESPELVYENLELTGEIRSLFYNDKYIGMLIEDSETDSSYDIKVFDLTGNIQYEMGTDKAYSHIAFAGNNVLMYSDSECEMYSFAGVCKFTYRFEEAVSALMSANGRDFVYAVSGETNIIRLQ